jgi:hypothetical protein
VGLAAVAVHETQLAVQAPQIKDSLAVTRVLQIRAVAVAVLVRLVKVLAERTRVVTVATAYRLRLLAQVFITQAVAVASVLRLAVLAVKAAAALVLEITLRHQ